MEYVFNQQKPNILVVDNFYKNPDEVLKMANDATFTEDNRYYKGRRSEKQFLLPYVKEEFERLLGVTITDWVGVQPMNGVFQITNEYDPLVYHADSQDYAAAIYLTKDAENMGTSFWKQKQLGFRYPSADEEICKIMFSDYNLVNQDNWELVDKVGCVYNRLVIWDAKLIHSASEYSSERLVQLFFFSVKK
jgi:hypothetical protein